MKRGPKPTVEYDGRVYACRRYTVEIPDLASMSRIAALMWLNRETVARGYSRRPANPLAGLGEAIDLKVKEES